jgi:predicted SAM-dependent methyltransferase
MKRINVGCGQTPTPGWTNYDNALTARIARMPLLPALLDRLHLLTDLQRSFIRAARASDIRYADAVRRIPEADRSVEVLYTSHMVEHLDANEARSFLREARRVLEPGGIIRVAVPDLRGHVNQYIADGDGDGFVARVYLSRPRPGRLLQKLSYLLVGDRHHQWMYDGPSLCRLITSAGFVDVRDMPAGQTSIPDPGPLDLFERSPESVFVEARNPG